MSDLHHHFTQIKNELSLTSEERALMRSNLEAFTRTPVQPVPLTSPYAPYFAFFMQPSRMVAFLLAFAVLGSGTSVLASDQALPGDALYSLKVNVNEKVEKAFAFTALSKAHVEIRHAEERIREIQLLAASGKEAEIVDAAQEAEVRIASARSTIQSLIEKDPELTDVDSELSYALSANAEILEAQAYERDDDTGVSLAGLARAIRGDTNDALETSAARAKKTFEKAQKRLADVPENVREPLLGELMLVEAELQQAEVDGSLEGFALVERHAYRVLALADSARRITEKTGKDITISFNEGPHEEADKAPAEAHMKTVEASTALMMMTEPAQEEVKEKSDDEEEEDTRMLRFRVMEDEDDDRDSSGKDEEKEDSSGSGKGN